MNHECHHCQKKSLYFTKNFSIPPPSKFEVEVTTPTNSDRTHAANKINSHYTWTNSNWRKIRKWRGTNQGIAKIQADLLRQVIQNWTLGSTNVNEAAELNDANFKK